MKLKNAFISNHIKLNLFKKKWEIPKETKLIEN